MLINDTYFLLASFFVFVLSNDLIFGVGKPMIIDFKNTNLERFKNQI